jgi:hypothetical protein
MAKTYKEKFEARVKRLCTQRRPKDDATAKLLEVKTYRTDATGHAWYDTLGYFPNTRFQRLLGRLRACYDARLWVGAKSMTEAWATCRRDDWMRWLLSSIVAHTSDNPFPYTSRAARLMTAEDYYDLDARAIRNRLPKLRLPKHAGDLA